jgi:hypothetical protein
MEHEVSGSVSAPHRMGRRRMGRRVPWLVTGAIACSTLVVSGAAADGGASATAVSGRGPLRRRHVAHRHHRPVGAPLGRRLRRGRHHGGPLPGRSHRVARRHQGRQARRVRRPAAHRDHRPRREQRPHRVHVREHGRVVGTGPHRLLADGRPPRVPQRGQVRHRPQLPRGARAGAHAGGPTRDLLRGARRRVRLLARRVEDRLHRRHRLLPGLRHLDREHRRQRLTDPHHGHHGGRLVAAPRSTRRRVRRASGGHPTAPGSRSRLAAATRSPGSCT